MEQFVIVKLQLMNSQLEYVVKKPDELNKKSKAIVMLHGYGSNKEDLFSFSDYMNPENFIFSVQAPLKMDYGAYCWWALNFDDSMNLTIDTTQAKNSIKMLHQFILSYLCEKYNFSYEKIILLGFSQGAMAAYALSVNFPKYYKKVIGLSGKIPHEIIKYNDLKDYSSHNFFCSHGIYDQVIPISIGRESSKWLSEKKINHKFYEFQSQHGISPENFEKMKLWIDKN